ncbi:MAG: nucleotidyltransferase family protein [Neobacillus sp.]
MTNSFGLYMDRLPRELQFMLNIIKAETEGEFQSLIQKDLSDVDWNLFFDLANHHRLYPLLYPRLKMIDVVPGDLIHRFSEEYRINTFRMMHLTAEMEEISNLFTKNQQRSIVLKGPVLGKDLYGDISLRTCRDIDILVPITDLHHVNNLLLKRGYVREEAFQFDPRFIDWKWRHHHTTYYQPYSKVKLEIHWRLNSGPGREPSFNELWERKRTSLQAEYPVNYLSKEDLFYFLVTHGARHGWSRIRWLMDIHELVSQNKMDWVRSIKLLKEFQSLHLGGQALILSSKLLNTSLQEEILALTELKAATRLAQDTIFYFEKMISLHTDPLPEYVESYHNKYLFSLKSTRNKILYLLSILYPSITDVNTIKLPNYLFLLYFPLRPFLLIIRKTRKHLLI